jgi:uncharacterized protein (TIGR03435 family)
MKLSRRDAACLFAAAALMPSRLLRPQQAKIAGAAGKFGPVAALPEFEVTSVKRNLSDSGWQGIDTSPGRIRADSVTLLRCIRDAYDMGSHQVIGGPDWINTDRWEILARADHPVDDDDVLMLMLRQLLADRFKLAIHRETRTLPAYVLEVAKNGPKMQRAEPGDSDTDMHGGRGGPATLEAKKTDMNRLAELLGWRADRMVVNRTGLDSTFNFTLHWAPDNVSDPKSGADDVSLFTAVGEQLGLRLRAARVPVEVLVIDHAERPSPN